MVYDEKDRFSKYEKQIKEICNDQFGFVWDKDNLTTKDKDGTVIASSRDMQRWSEHMFLINWIDKVGGGDSLHWNLHDYISNEWSIHTPQMNCHTLNMYVEEHNMLFSDIVELVNKHEMFYVSKEEIEQIEKDRIVFQKVLVESETKKAKGLGYRIRKKLNEWGHNTSHPLISAHTLDNEHAFRTYKDIAIDQSLERLEAVTQHSLETPHLGEYNTQGFNAIQKTLHPKTAPALKEILIEDYFELQKDLGMPFEDENSTSGYKPNQGVIRKQLEVGGIAHIWHTYGLLASQWQQRKDMSWKKENIDEVGYLSTPKEEETEEYFIFLSALKRLQSIYEDDTKIFTLLIHLYQEFSNDAEWKERWDELVRLEPEYDAEKYHAGIFAQRILAQEYPYPTIFGNLYLAYERLNDLEGYEEQLKENENFDTYMKLKYFSYRK